MKPILYCAWFCPFAQRSWISLVEKGVDFEYKEQDPFNKTPEFLAVNPSGKVPALVHDDQVVFESGIVNEYIDEAWPNKNPLYPPMSEPMLRAQTRIYLDIIEKKIAAPFITLLVTRDAKEKEATVKTLRLGFAELFKGASSEGPFFFGADFSIVDIMLAPFIPRMEVLGEYVDLKSLEGNETHPRFLTWWAAVKERPSVKGTTAAKHKLQERYGKVYVADILGK